MKPLTLEAVNHAINSLAGRPDDPPFYKSPEQPYLLGAFAAVQKSCESHDARLVAMTVTLSAQQHEQKPCVGVVIARVNEALRREGFLDG